MNTKKMTSDEKNMGWRLVNSSQYHNYETGLLAWKPGTTAYVKELQKRLIKEEKES